MNRQSLNPPAIVPPAEDLAYLATEINREHEAALGAVRTGLEHARKAGELLLRWLPWLRTDLRIKERQARKYMQVAQRLDELVSNVHSDADLSIDGALKLLAESPPSPTVAPDIAVPPALACYRDEGFLDDEAVNHLLGLAADYGHEVLVSGIDWDMDPPTVPGDLCGFLHVIRPLDCPTFWPWPTVKPGGEGTAAVVAALKALFEDARTRPGGLPQWELTAFWFASKVALMGDHDLTIRDRHASILVHNLGVWRQSFRSALVWMAHCGFEAPKYGEKPEGFEGEAEEYALLWWGYYADLRHAGVLDAAKETSDELGEGTAALGSVNRYPVIADSMLAGSDVMNSEVSYPLPSSMLRRMRRLAYDA
jgi:hypothetical protein